MCCLLTYVYIHLHLVVIDDQPVKAVKFKIEITEKAGYLASCSSTASNTSTFSNTSNITTSSNSTSFYAIPSSCAVAAILATVDHKNHYHGNPSANSTLSGPTSAGVRPSTVMSSGVPEVVVAARRASDGGSILSSAAAAVSTSLAAAARNPFSSNNHHQQYHHQLHHTGGAYPPLPHLSSTLPPRIVKVTLHQQQGANSTLRAIYEKLQGVWDQQALIFEQQQRQAASCSTISTTVTMQAPIMQKAPRGPAI